MAFVSDDDCSEYPQVAPVELKLLQYGYALLQTAVGLWGLVLSYLGV